MIQISIIVPTLNESANLEKLIKHIRLCGTTLISKEVIIADGGSVDGTLELAQKLGLTTIYAPESPPGRSYLLNKAAKVAKGEILLFLDADSLVPEGFDQDILAVLSKKGVVGGAFEFKLDGPQFGLRVVECINRIRYRIWPRYYGDQGIFVRKEDFFRTGGYPEVGLMEASDFCVTLAGLGRLFLIKKPMVTSARRFLNGGIYRVLAFDIRMWWRNLTGQETERFAREYWQPVHKEPKN